MEILAGENCAIILLRLYVLLIATVVKLEQITLWNLLILRLKANGPAASTSFRWIALYTLHGISSRTGHIGIDFALAKSLLSCVKGRTESQALSASMITQTTDSGSQSAYWQSTKMNTLCRSTSRIIHSSEAQWQATTDGLRWNLKQRPSLLFTKLIQSLITLQAQNTNWLDPTRHHELVTCSDVQNLKTLGYIGPKSRCLCCAVQRNGGQEGYAGVLEVWSEPNSDGEPVSGDIPCHCDGPIQELPRRSRESRPKTTWTWCGAHRWSYRGAHC